MDLVSDLSLDSNKSRDVHQHRVVLADVPACEPDGACHDKDADCRLERLRQTGDLMMNRMLQWQQICVVIDGVNDPVRGLDEHPGRPEVVVGWIEAHDKVAREQIVPDHRVFAVGIDEDIRERSG